MSDSITDLIADFDEHLERVMQGVKVEDLSGADQLTFDWNPGSYEGALNALYFSVLRRIRAKKAYLATFGSEDAIAELSREHEASWRKSQSHDLKQLDEYYALRNGLKAALVSIRSPYWSLPAE